MSGDGDGASLTINILISILPAHKVFANVEFVKPHKHKPMRCRNFSSELTLLHARVGRNVCMAMVGSGMSV